MNAKCKKHLDECVYYVIQKKMYSNNDNLIYSRFIDNTKLCSKPP